MSDFLAFLTEAWELPFMQRAFLVAMTSSIVCGIVGTHVVLRGMAFIGDTVAHAVFPGVAIAFVLQANLLIGGIAAGLLTAMGIAIVSQNRRLKEDTVIGVFFAAAFGLGVVILSSAPGYSGSLESFLFGQILGVSTGDVRLVAIVGAGVLVVAAAVHSELITVGLDRETATVLGLPVFALDMVLYAMVTVAIVISLQAVGNILVLALLITPAACARLLTDRLGVMMLLSPLIGVGSSIVGLYASYAFNLAAGGLIVLASTSVFLTCWLFTPRGGLLRRGRPSAAPDADTPSPVPPTRPDVQTVM